MRSLLSILFVLIFLDVFLTGMGLNAGFGESNPFALFFMQYSFLFFLLGVIGYAWVLNEYFLKATVFNEWIVFSLILIHLYAVLGWIAVLFFHVNLLGVSGSAWFDFILTMFIVSFITLLLFKK